MAWRHLSEEDLTEYADGGASTPLSLAPPRAPFRTPRGAFRVPEGQSRGGLAQARLQAAEEHLRQCPACAAALARVRSASEALRVLSMVPAPDGLRRSVVAKLAVRHASALTCRKAVPLLQAHLDATLPPVTEISLGRHLAGCGRCRAALAALSSLVRAVRDLPTVESPRRVREAVQAAGQLRSGKPSWAPWGARWRPAFALAALVAVGGLMLTARFVANHTGPAQLAAGGRQGQAALAQPSEVGGSMEVAASPSLTGDAQLTAEGALPVEEAPAVSSPTPPAVRLVRVPVSLVSDRPKGPTPEGMTVGHSLPSTPLPSALQTLRVVASNASHGGDLQRAMELAGERFSTLSSEAMLARLPEAGALEPGGEGTVGGNVGASVSGETGVSLPGGEHRSDAPGGPAWHGANSGSAPFA